MKKRKREKIAYLELETSVVDTWEEHEYIACCNKESDVTHGN